MLAVPGQIVDLGDWAPSQTISRGSGPEQIFVRGDFLFVAQMHSDKVEVFRINRAATNPSGVLTHVGIAFTGGITPEGIAVSHDGRTVYVANRQTEDVSLLSVDANGTLRRAGLIAVGVTGTTPDPTTGGNGAGLFATGEEQGLRWLFSSSYSVAGTLVNPGPIGMVTWYWRIQAADRAGNLSAWSQPFVVHLGNASPPSTAPTLLSPGNGATVSQPVNFDWSGVSGATSYEIQIDNSSSMSAPLIASMTVTSSQASIGNLSAQQLWWRVRAINSGGSGPFSTVRSFTVQSAPATAALSSVSMSPTSVVGGNNSTGTVRLSSAAPAGGVVVTLSDNSSAVSVPAGVTVNAGATSANFTATTTSVTSSTSSTITATYNGTSRTATLTVTPASGGSLPAPSLISPAWDARFSPGQMITFDWSDVSGAATYQLQIDNSESFSAPLTLSQSTTVSQFATNSLPTQRMWWRVRAVSSSGATGAWSSIRRFEVKQ